MSEKTMSYVDRLIANSDPKKVEAKVIEKAGKKASLQLNADLFAAENAVEEAKEAVDAALCAMPFSTGNAVDAMRDLRDAEEDLADIKSLTPYFK